MQKGACFPEKTAVSERKTAVSFMKNSRIYPVLFRSVAVNILFLWAKARNPVPGSPERIPGKGKIRQFDMPRV